MNDNMNAILQNEINDYSFDFDELEKQLEEDLEESIIELDFLKKEKDKIGNQDDLGNVIMEVVWDQFILQIGSIAGEEFIKENHGLKLDLRNKAHILTAEGFEKGKLPDHNFENVKKYEKRYKETRADFQTDPNMEVKMSKNMRYNKENRTYERLDSVKKEWVGKTRYNGETQTWEDYNSRNGKWEKKLDGEARKNFDTRTSKEKGSKSVNKDHIISAVEQIRDMEAAAYMDRPERQDFAKSNVNIQDLDSSANQSKSDLSVDEWLNEKRKDGQGQAEYFGVDEKEIREVDKKAREEYKNKKNEAKKKAVKEGKKSQKDEAFRIGGKALRAAVMGLLAELIRNIIGKLIVWLKSKEKNIDTLVAHVKDAISEFLNNIKQNLLTSGKTISSTVLTAIFGPIKNTIQKIWTIIKQGGKSVKESINYIKNPENRHKSYSVLMLEVGKIILTGLTGMGALFLGEIIEKSLMSIPIFAIEIPLIGSLANILGIFFGAVVAGIAGAIVLHLIDRIISKKKKEEANVAIINKGNKILANQNKIKIINEVLFERDKEDARDSIIRRHQEVVSIMKDAYENIMEDFVEDYSESENMSVIDEEDVITNKKIENIRNDLDDLLASLN